MSTALLRFAETIDLHAEIISRFLPVNFTISNVEQVLRSDFTLLGNFHQRYFSGDISLLSNPVSDDVISRGPCEAANAWNLKRFLFKQEESVGLVNVNGTIAH